jgi:hypothetical protein
MCTRLRCSTIGRTRWSQGRRIGGEGGGEGGNCCGEGGGKEGDREDESGEKVAISTHCVAKVNGGTLWAVEMVA